MRYIMLILLLAGNGLAQVHPDLVLADTQGTAHKLGEYGGKVVLLNFWATWCVPCKQEMPIFVEAAKRYRDRGFIVVAASLDDEQTRKYVPRFARSYRMTFPVLVGATAEMMKQFGLSNTVPSTVFLDEEGNVVDKIVGQAKKKDVVTRIEQLLAKKEHGL